MNYSMHGVTQRIVTRNYAGPRGSFEYDRAHNFGTLENKIILEQQAKSNLNRCHPFGSKHSWDGFDFDA